ncbi:hypothetical protein PV963_40295 [Streptomyces coeruleorubidus]|nr:hypothetical protein [Streptomyces coeruleorubidus]WDV56140.1 hypothetical protein PV963_40295 [Streptomyces coeruleorubidus]
MLVLLAAVPRLLFPRSRFLRKRQAPLPFMQEGLVVQDADAERVVPAGRR